MLPADDAAEVEARNFLAPAVIGAFALVLMVSVALAKGLPVHDPDAKYVGSSLALIAVIVMIFVVLDVLPRAWRAARASSDGFGGSARTIFGERWWGRRGVIVIACLLGFYATYLSYRNLKSFLPFINGTQHDSFLLSSDRWLFFGHEPSTLLHDLLGTGVSAQVLSAVYLAFLTFVPVSLGFALIWYPRIAAGVWYVTALCIDWMLGVLSYYALPSLGPVYARPRLYSDLPVTGVSELQQTLMEHRHEVLADPKHSDAVQSIAGFASLHMAVVLTAALIAHLSGAPRGLRIALWIYLGLTTLSTIYFGWHYVLDDVAGAAIGIAAVTAGALLTGSFQSVRAGRPSWLLRLGRWPKGRAGVQG